MQIAVNANSLLRIKSIPVDTGRKLNVYKTFRRRLLNVLCTFNLRPVSTGIGYMSQERLWKLTLPVPILDREKKLD